MAKREKPKLHLIRSGGPEVYCADLDWFFGCFEYEAGLRSTTLERIDFDTGNYRMLVKRPEDWSVQFDIQVQKQIVRDPSCTSPWNDWHVSFGKRGAFTRARKIWQRFSRLRWSEQEMLRRYYEPRQYFPPELKPIPDAIVHALHRSYYGLEAA
jgi:hypothetical protein